VKLSQEFSTLRKVRNSTASIHACGHGLFLSKPYVNHIIITFQICVNLRIFELLNPIKALIDFTLQIQIWKFNKKKYLEANYVRGNSCNFLNSDEDWWVFSFRVRIWSTGVLIKFAFIFFFSPFRVCQIQLVTAH
jgi:hypothetical protein